MILRIRRLFKKVGPALRQEKVFRVIPRKTIEKEKVFQGIGRKTIRAVDSAYRFWIRPLLRGFDIP